MGLLSWMRGGGSHGHETLRDRQAAADKLTLQALRGAGADLTKPHEIEHHFLAEQERTIRDLAARGMVAGYEVRNLSFVDEPDHTPFWTLDLVRWTVPSLENMVEQSSQMTEWAQQTGALYDGWGCIAVS